MAFEDQEESKPFRFQGAMNKRRKKILLSYFVFLCIIALFSFIIISYAIYEKDLASFADIFHSVTNEEEVVWIRLTIVALVSLFVFSSVIFAGLLILLKKNNNHR